ncbi:MAG TPA: MFS transporter, partial [Urbifossiella sp.]|nr:MFS transporter [Urbifossiella sp.]
YFAVQRLQETSPDTYSRYVARNEKGEPATKDFPLVTEILPNEVPPIAGLDNAKLKVFDDYEAGVDAQGNRKPDAKPTTLDSDLATIAQQEKEGKPVEAKLKENLSKLKSWWERDGKPNYATDVKPLEEARKYGAKTALMWTAVVPAVLAVGFLLLIGYFAATGGYTQVHLDSHAPRDPRDKYGAPAESWGR